MAESQSHVIQFTIDILGYTSQQTSDMLVGSYPLFSAMLAEEMPEVDGLVPGSVAQCNIDDPSVLCREIRYELNAVVWEPLRAMLQVAAPGLIRYNDIVHFSTKYPGFRCRTDWPGVPGIDAKSIQVVSSMTGVDDFIGCQLTYIMSVKCTIPIIGTLIEKIIADAYRRTVERVPRVVQKYYSVFGENLK
jgi:hypothetical protein